MEKSPFPGMDPFLELNWPDVHAALITYARDQLQERLPPDLVARMESRVVLEDESGNEMRTHRPDVSVAEHGVGGAATAVLTAPEIAVAEPDALINEKDELASERYIEIVDAATRSRVITAIEFISPSNKLSGLGRDLYCRKRAECLQAGVNFVEIDLTSDDRYTLLPFMRHSPVRPTYVACVRRGHDLTVIEVYYLPLSRPLKTIRIPLRRSDPDIPLELQPLVEQAYIKGRYGNLNYRHPIELNFSSHDAEWLVERLRATGKR